MREERNSAGERKKILPKKRPERIEMKSERKRERKEKPKETAEDGLRRLAFGDIRDAVRLLYSTPEDIKALDTMDLDLYTVSELKRGKDGQVEVKFYDRLKALQGLMEAENGRDGEKIRPLYEALRESALLLAGKKPNTEDQCSGGMEEGENGD